VILLLLAIAISIVLSVSSSSSSILPVCLPHIEHTSKTVYFDVFASAQIITILKVANLDEPVNRYENASAVQSVVFICFSKTMSTINTKPSQKVRLH
jgi:hypothetical protein